MARYTVTQNFCGLTRRFSAGMEIDDSEIDGEITPERWVELERLKPVSAPKPGRGGKVADPAPVDDGAPVPSLPSADAPDAPQP